MATTSDNTSHLTNSEQQFQRILSQALKSRGNLLILGRCAEALQLKVIEERAQTLVTGEGVVTDIDRGRALWNLIQEAIERLRPTNTKPEPTPAWRLYAIAEGLYIQGKSTKAIATELGISPRTFYRERRAAVEALVTVVWQIEKQQ